MNLNKEDVINQIAEKVGCTKVAATAMLKAFAETLSESLKEDGELGPKTALQTRLFMVGNGYNSLEKALKNKIYTKS